MNENNESGNRWEKPADDAAEPVETPAAVEADTPPTPPAPAASEGPAPVNLPGWVTKRGLAVAGIATAFFLGGGGLGYAVGASGNDDGRQVPARFDRSGFAPDGQGPGGQMPGGGQFQQGPQGQSQDQSQGSGSGTTTS